MRRRQRGADAESGEHSVRARARGHRIPQRRRRQRLQLARANRRACAGPYAARRTSAAAGQIRAMSLGDVLGRHRAELAAVASGETDTHRILRDRVVSIVVLTVVIDLICAVLAYVLEHDAHNTQVTSFGSALFWTTTQLLTVSSSFQNPLTTGGQILDVFMEIWAMLIVASLT